MGRIIPWRTKKQKPKEESYSFYLYDYTVLDDPQANGKLGGVKIITRGDEKVVMMTKDQAKYWLDQAVIGTAPRASLSRYAKLVHEQMFGNA